MSADNLLLHGWIMVMREHPWPRTNAVSAIRIILATWESDWASVEADAPKSNEVLREVLLRCELIDRVFELAVRAEASRKPSRTWLAARQGMDAIVAQAQTLSPSFWRDRLHRAITDKDSSALARIEAEVCAALLTTSEQTQFQRAARFVSGLARDGATDDTWVPAHIVSVLVSQLASLSERGLRCAAPVLSVIADHRPDWLSEANLRLVETALVLAQPRVAYGKDGEIDPDAVPWLRHLLAGLLRRWKTAFASRWTADLQAWTDELACDPLPEVRREVSG